MKQRTLLAGTDIFTVTDFLSGPECVELIKLSESIGFEAATVHTIGGHQHLEDLRNNTRVTLDDSDRAERLWRLASPFVPPEIAGCRAVGINERLRFYRYDPGQQFDWHSDGYFLRDSGERSRLTFMIYLNGGFGGGETSFEDLSVAPSAGLALFFKHMLFHKGEPVTEGRKYVLRSDVMYTAG